MSTNGSSIPSAAAAVRRRGSIRNELIKVTMTTVWVALLLAGVALIANEVLAYRERTIDSLESLALVVADRSTGAIAFDDPELANKNLYALRSKPDITTACIYKISGALFAEFVRGKDGDPGCGSRAGTLRGAAKADSPIPVSDLAVSSLILLDDSPIGHIVIRSERLNLWAEIARISPTLLMILLGSLIAAYFLATKLNQRIADPIIALADTSKQISLAHDYSLRAAATDAPQEVGDLVRQFNEMIRLIEEQSSELVNAKTNLEKTVSERTRELEVARRHAESANEAKSAFLANMSHELRTPLTSIMGFSELLEMDPALTEGHKEKLRLIGRSSDHLLELIDDVLELSKIEAGRVSLEFAETAVGELFESLAGTFAERAKRRGIELRLDNRIDADKRFQGDLRKIRQVLNNLVDNAMKFTKTGHVAVAALDEGPANATGLHRIVFLVKDTGVGIGEDELPTVFEAFSQTASGRVSGQGSGLGLAIVRQYVALLGGKISVESRPGVGTTFRFEVPLREMARHIETDSGSPARHRMLAPDQPHYRMLIVDDNPQNRVLLKEVLETAGFPVRTANNGREGVAAFHDWRPHLIWMDMKMPVLDGYAATREIRGSTTGNDVAIIALTANIAGEYQNGIFEAGCDDVVRKPFRVADVYAAIEKHLGVTFTNSH